MQYLGLYTPSVRTDGPPAPEHMQAMGNLVGEMMASGKLLHTAPLGRRETGGMRISLNGGKLDVTENPQGESVLLSANGFALLQADSKEELTANIRRFLETAGDGSVEIIALAEMPGAPAV
jgi:hypothetical protein